jgi:hypothetical protein
MLLIANVNQATILKISLLYFSEIMGHHIYLIGGIGNVVTMLLLSVVYSIMVSHTIKQCTIIFRHPEKNER